jgi:serine/threonine protein kinase
MSQDHLFALPQGYELLGYRFREVLGSGGYGITYRGEEIALGRAVAIKEYLPGTFARRASDGVTVKPRDTKQQELFGWGIERFRQEAETLVQLQHPNIVRVLRYFAANGTAYIVMVYEKGTSLGERLRDGATLPEPELRAVLDPLLSGLEVVHKARFLHRDVKPDNIYLRDDGSPVLLDFGSARQAIGARTQAITSIVSPGYSPFEQYGKSAGDQGPWTDIYALGATLYRCIAGKRPPPALDRIANKAPVEPAAELGQGDYDPALLKAIDASLAIRAEERPQDVAAFRALMRGGAGATAPPPPAGEPGATLVAGVPSSVKAGLYAAEPGATLVAGDAPGVPPAMAREAKPRPKPAPPRPHAPANNGAPAKSGGLGQMLANLQPKHLAIIAVAIFATLILMLVLLVVLLARR